MLTSQPLCTVRSVLDLQIKQLWLNRQSVIDARSGWPVFLLDKGVLLAVSWHGDEDQGSSPCSCAFPFCSFVTLVVILSSLYLSLKLSTMMLLVQHALYAVHSSR